MSASRRLDNGSSPRARGVGHLEPGGLPLLASAMQAGSASGDRPGEVSDRRRGRGPTAARACPPGGGLDELPDGLAVLQFGRAGGGDERRHDPGQLPDGEVRQGVHDGSSSHWRSSSSTTVGASAARCRHSATTAS